MTFDFFSKKLKNIYPYNILHFSNVGFSKLGVDCIIIKASTYGTIVSLKKSEVTEGYFSIPKN